MNSTILDTDETKDEFNLFYVIFELLVAIFAVIGNALVIFVFRKERKLRRRTNYYIVSLAAADFLVGLLGIPFAIMASVGLPTNLHACLFTVSLLVVLCTISIFCLVAVSVDRYWAILHPMGYSRNVRTKTALVIIVICWVAGSIVGFLPLMGWHKNEANNHCYFLKVMDHNYLVFLYFGTIITPAIILIGFYAHIYQVVLKQLRQIVTMLPDNGNSTTNGCGPMIRRLGVAQRNEVRATQNLAIIVLFFMICWIPLYTVNCFIAFSKSEPEINKYFMYFCIILSHANSAGNPLLYAYHLRDFRAALKNFFCMLFKCPQYCEPLQRTPFTSNNFNYRCAGNDYNKYLLSCHVTQIKPAQQISRAARKSAAVAIATSIGTPTRQQEIWKIPDDSMSSNDSLSKTKSPRGNNEKMLMIRPATPYRPLNNISELNQAYLDTCSFDSDDVFNEDTLPYHDYNFDDYDFETCLNDTSIQQVPQKRHCLSSSSPQLARGLFLVENGRKPARRSFSLIERGKNNTRKKSIKKSLSRSLSDEGHVSMDSAVTRKSSNSLCNNNNNEKFVW